MNRLHRFLMRTREQRRKLIKQLMPTVDPMVLHHVRSARQQCHREQQHRGDPSMLKTRPFEIFYQQMKQDVLSWRAPDPHWLRLAERYQMPLEELPLELLVRWLSEREKMTEGQCLDLEEPLTCRTLEFLEPLSRWYALEHLVQWQIIQIRIQQQLRLVVRSYLALLFTANRVASTVDSAAKRLRAIRLLRQRDKDEQQAASASRDGSPSADAFTSFHSPLSDLCENCLMLRVPSVPVERVCACCGHEHHAQSTSSAPSHVIVNRKPEHEPHDHPQWVASDEKCDFLVLNAYFQALAPLDHAHRSSHRPTTLWQLAMARASPAVRVLYDELRIVTLDDLLRVCSSQSRQLQVIEKDLPMPEPAAAMLGALASAFVLELQSVLDQSRQDKQQPRRAIQHSD